MVVSTGGSHVIVGTIAGLLKMFSERGVGPLTGLNAFIVDNVASVFQDTDTLAQLVDLVVLVYNQLENPGKWSDKVGITCDSGNTVTLFCLIYRCDLRHSYQLYVYAQRSNFQYPIVIENIYETSNLSCSLFKVSKYIQCIYI